MSHLTTLILIIGWISGIVIAKGFWSSFFAIVFAPYSLYLTVERILQVNGLL